MLRSFLHWLEEHVLRADGGNDRRLVARYCDVLQRTRGAPLHIKLWDDVTVIDARGDAVETVKVVATVRDEETYFFRFRIGPAWDQPEKERSKAECVVRGTDQGLPYDTTTSWLADGRLEVLAHLPEPAEVGEDLRIMVTLVWPGMCKPLVQGQSDDYLLHFGRGADFVRYVVVLPEGEDVQVERIGFEAGDEGYRVKTGPNATGRTEVSLIARDVPARHRFGFRLDLR